MAASSESEYISLSEMVNEVRFYGREKSSTMEGSRWKIVASEAGG